MIPRIPADQHLPVLYAEFLQALSLSPYRGEIRTDYATRLVTATDNSVYQVVPLAVLYPKNEQDIQEVLRLLSSERFVQVKLSPRGGGTGTNGQSLCDGIIIDVSKYFRDILELNLEQGWVRVQPGVVLDQLNAFLKPHGLFFAPNLSPSSRATLGGMIGTDASGKGSRIYGKTSEHVLAMRAAVLDGSVIETAALSPAQLEQACARPGLEGHIYREVRAIVSRNQERIATQIPQLKRFLTGYDLAHVEQDDHFDLGRVICGSEGTLAILTEAKLRLTPIARFKTLFAIRYSEFDAALRAANRLVSTNPGAIETVDDTIVSLAKEDVIWHRVAHLLDAPGEPAVAAVNLVEFESDDSQLVEQKVLQLARLLDEERGQPGKSSGYHIATDPSDIAALWTLRKKGVGLLGNAKGERRPVPFVEDTAVPPEHLADYIQEFRALLDKRGLRYGMFGHVDVGCLHVRPALDMKDEADEVMLRGISDEVVALVKKYGGVLWGEHGRGYRSEYTPTFFGDELYQELRAVKAAFDPHNQLNPGKLATPTKSTDKLVSVDAIKRGSFDRQIHPEVRLKYDVAIHCNGNGACFDYNPDAVMCPSSKVTKERIHSPKGRAGLLREWLRLLGNAGHLAGTAAGEASPGLALFNGRSAQSQDFSHEVYDAMNGCLACKACATQCPVKVDIPHMRASFYEQYHTRYRRPLKDYFIAVLELVLGVVGRWPRLFNFFTQLAVSQWILKRWVGIVDSPALGEKTLKAGLAARNAESFNFERLNGLSAAEKQRTVLILQDAFTSYYEPNVALATYDLLTHWGRRVIVLPFRENGKGLHIKGFLSRFRRVVRSNASYYRQLADLGIKMIGIEPAVTLTYRDEYKHELSELGFEVQLLQEYLNEEVSELVAQHPVPKLQVQGPLRLFGHCTERTYEPQSQKLWQNVFRAVGAELELETTGCCGMCGVFGHETVHLAESHGIFDLSWKKKINAAQAQGRAVVATGHSCRSQVKRFAGFVPRHPVEVLAHRVMQS